MRMLFVVVMEDNHNHFVALSQAFDDYADAEEYKRKEGKKFPKISYFIESCPYPRKGY